jgi:hypothetical protein
MFCIILSDIIRLMVDKKSNKEWNRVNLGEKGGDGQNGKTPTNPTAST